MVFISDSEDLHPDISLDVRLTRVEMALAGWFSFCRTSPARAQCSTYSFYPSLVPLEEFSSVLQQSLEQPARDVET